MQNSNSSGPNIYKLTPLLKDKDIPYVHMSISLVHKLFGVFNIANMLNLTMKCNVLLGFQIFEETTKNILWSFNF